MTFSSPSLLFSDSTVYSHIWQLYNSSETKVAKRNWESPMSLTILNGSSFVCDGIFKHIHWPSQFSQFSTCFQTLRFNFPAVSLLLLNNRNESKLQFCCNSAARSSDSNAHSEMLTILFANTADWKIPQKLSLTLFSVIWSLFKLGEHVFRCFVSALLSVAARWLWTSIK